MAKDKENSCKFFLNFVCDLKVEFFQKHHINAKITGKVHSLLIRSCQRFNVIIFRLNPVKIWFCLFGNIFIGSNPIRKFLTCLFYSRESFTIFVSRFSKKTFSQSHMIILEFYFIFILYSSFFRNNYKYVFPLR